MTVPEYNKLINGVKNHYSINLSLNCFHPGESYVEYCIVAGTQTLTRLLAPVFLCPRECKLNFSKPSRLNLDENN